MMRCVSRIEKETVQTQGIFFFSSSSEFLKMNKLVFIVMESATRAPLEKRRQGYGGTEKGTPNRKQKKFIYYSLIFASSSFANPRAYKGIKLRGNIELNNQIQ